MTNNRLIKITVAILCRNEEKNIERCLQSVCDLADEILLLDDDSIDKTLDIAAKFGAVIVRNSNHEDFARARNLAMEKARNKWVFFIDSDESIKIQSSKFKVQSDNFKFKINHLISANPKIQAFRVKRHDIMWGRTIKHGENGLWNEVRLVKKDAGKWEGRVHEVFKTNGSIGQLDNVFLKHYPHQSVKDFLTEINLYSEIRAKELHERGVKSNVWQIMFYPLGKFLLNYVLRLGFLDGTPGFVVATMMSMHTFLTRAKLYLLVKTVHVQN